jgi:hypothetical protein
VSSRAIAFMESIRDALDDFSDRRRDRFFGSAIRPIKHRDAIVVRTMSYRSDVVVAQAKAARPHLHARQIVILQDGQRAAGILRNSRAFV